MRKSKHRSECTCILRARNHMWWFAVIIMLIYRADRHLSERLSHRRCHSSFSLPSQLRRSDWNLVDQPQSSSAYDCPRNFFVARETHRLNPWCNACCSAGITSMKTLGYSSLVSIPLNLEQGERCDLASSIDLVNRRLRLHRRAPCETSNPGSRRYWCSLYADMIIIRYQLFDQIEHMEGPQPFKHHWYQIERTAKLKTSCQDWPAPPNPILVIRVQQGFVGDTLLLTCIQTVRTLIKSNNQTDLIIAKSRKGQSISIPAMGSEFLEMSWKSASIYRDLIFDLRENVSPLPTCKANLITSLLRTE